LNEEKIQFTFGIDVLNEYFGSALTPGTTLLVAGNPGAGKTTLASTICYKNALKGLPCLYVSFVEDREKFLRIMKSLGMDFEKLEQENLFKYIRIPVIATEDVTDFLSSAINEEIKKQGTKVIVIDSVNPLLDALGRSAVKRSVLQNYLYDLTNMIKGIAILVAELPLGRVVLPEEIIEFIADAIILMKHEVKHSIIHRKIEFRKFRGVKLILAEAPYSIIEGLGIKLFMPPILSKVPSRHFKKGYTFPSKILSKYIPNIAPGSSIFVGYPPHGRSYLYTLLPITAMLLWNDCSVGIFSYRYSEDELKWYLSLVAQDLGIDLSVISSRLKFIVSSNPTTYSSGELANIESELIRKTGPDAVVYHGIEILYMVRESREEHIRSVYNAILATRTMGAMSIGMGSVYDESVFKAESVMSEVVFRLKYLWGRKLGQLRPYLYIWRTGSEPAVLKPEELENCLTELSSNLKKKFMEGTAGNS